MVYQMSFRERRFLADRTEDVRVARAAAPTKPRLRREPKQLELPIVEEVGHARRER